MFELANVVAASDLMPSSEAAVERAAWVAVECGAKLSVIHVVDFSPLAPLRKFIESDHDDVERKIVDQIRDELRYGGQAVQRQFGLAPALHVARGDLYTQLAAYIDAVPADLLVLGAKAGGGLPYNMLGAETERLVISSVCPSLVAKQPAVAPYRKVLVAVDFSSRSLRALEIAHAVAPKAEIHVLNVFSVAFEEALGRAGVSRESLDAYRLIANTRASERLKRLIASAGLDQARTHAIVREGDILRHILECEEQLGCDMVVVGKHGDDVPNDLILGSVTKHVLTRAHSDVLIAT